MTTPHDYWLEQPAATATPSLADLRRRDAEVQRVTLRRNILEFVAGGIASLVLLVMCGLALRHAGEPAELVRAFGFAALPLGLNLLLSNPCIFVLAQVRDRDIRALSCKENCDGAADARVAPGNQGNFPIQFL